MHPYLEIYKNEFKKKKTTVKQTVEMVLGGNLITSRDES